MSNATTTTLEYTPIKVGDIVAIERAGTLIPCRVMSIPDPKKGEVWFRLEGIGNTGTFEANYFEMHRASWMKDFHDGHPTLQECMEKFDRVDPDSFGRMPTGDDEDTLPIGKPSKATVTDLPKMAMCWRCGQLVRPGMVGMEDHLEGCQASSGGAISPDPVTANVSRLMDDAARMLAEDAKEAEVEAAREKACADLLATFSAGVDPETPGRMARALGELLGGYGADFGPMLKTFPRGDADSGIVIVRDIPFASVCEHHVLPFTGTATVAYLPSDRIVGLSKIPRLVGAVTRRLQVQERIGAQVADAIVKHVGARGVFVVLKSKHTCMTLRGAKCPGEMVTSTIRGVFEDEPAARAEVLSLINLR